MWKYNKIKTSDGSFLYNAVESVNSLDVGEAEMINYAYDVYMLLESNMVLSMENS